MNFPGTVPVATLEGAWEVAFDPAWGGPEHLTFPRLQDWTKRAEPGIRYYSGMATYRKTFEAPNIPDGRAYLDLGTVHEMAAVSLNGKKLGVVWCAPWRVDITDALKAKDNRLEITVANLWRNRLLGDRKLPETKRLTRTALRYRARGELLPSGLIGPVVIEAGTATGHSSRGP